MLTHQSPEQAVIDHKVRLIIPECVPCEPQMAIAICPAPAQSLEQAVIDHKVRLIILDSAASLARADFAPGSLPDRQRMLGQQVSLSRRRLWEVDGLLVGGFRSRVCGRVADRQRVLGQQVGWVV